MGASSAAVFTGRRAGRAALNQSRRVTWQDHPGSLAEAGSGNGLLLARLCAGKPGGNRSNLADIRQLLPVCHGWRLVSRCERASLAAALAADGRRGRSFARPSSADGVLVDVRPQDGAIPPDPDKVYRSGLAFFIPAGKLAEVGHEIHAED